MKYFSYDNKKETIIITYVFLKLPTFGILNKIFTCQNTYIFKYLSNTYIYKNLAFSNLSYLFIIFFFQKLYSNICFSFSKINLEYLTLFLFFFSSIRHESNFLDFLYPSFQDLFHNKNFLVFTTFPFCLFTYTNIKIMQIYNFDFSTYLPYTNVHLYNSHLCFFFFSFTFSFSYSK